MAAVLERLDHSISALDVAYRETLLELIGSLKRESPDDPKTFVDLFGRALKVLHRSELEMARKLKVARPTIGRWVRGQHLPHPLMRGPVFRALLQMAEAEARSLASEADARPARKQAVAR